MSHLSQLFTEIGGQFITPEAELIEKLKHVKAFVFDWDGVFTDAGKDHLLQSRFNEADSMGTNLLRFSYYLHHKTIPVTAIISGEKNSAAFTFVDRERFHASYSKFANKLDATNHLCNTYNLQPKEICFVFDDVLDLSLAEVCGVRIFIQRKANPLLNEYVIKHFLADYVTGASSGESAVREACELLIGLSGNYNEVITERKIFSDTYAQYLSLRKATNPVYYTTQDGIIIETKP
ncbi:MAG: phosphatase [Bacteroidetes bacterium]|nr:phosphatase [Bacteroidota bacterium]